MYSSWLAALLSQIFLSPCGWLSVHLHHKIEKKGKPIPEHSFSGNFHLSLWLVLKFGTCQSERLSLLLDNHQSNYIKKLKRKKSCAWAFILRQFQTRVVEEASINNFALGNSNILNGSSKDDYFKWKKMGILLLNSWWSLPITSANATETLDWDFCKHCIVQLLSIVIWVVQQLRCFLEALKLVFADSTGGACCGEIDTGNVVTRLLCSSWCYHSSTCPISSTLPPSSCS
jgi:hypothetical protein